MLAAAGTETRTGLPSAVSASGRVQMVAPGDPPHRWRAGLFRHVVGLRTGRQPSKPRRNCPRGPAHGKSCISMRRMQVRECPAAPQQSSPERPLTASGQVGTGDDRIRRAQARPPGGSFRNGRGLGRPVHGPLPRRPRGPAGSRPGLLALVSEGPPYSCSPLQRAYIRRRLQPGGFQ